MCDYSLQHLASRPAKVGDRLVTSEFKNTMTRGLADICESGVAVCLLPGTQLVLEGDYVRVERRGWFGAGIRARKIRSRVAKFTQINEDVPFAHRDALEFPSGETVLLSSVLPGQKVTVLQLPVIDQPGGGSGTLEAKRSVVAPRAPSEAELEPEYA